MSVLSTFISVVKSAVGIPRLIPVGIKRSVSKLMTFGLKRMGLDVRGIERQIVKVFEKPATLGERMDIYRLTEREAFRQLTAAHNYNSPFPRSAMFETDFRGQENYLFRTRIGYKHPVTGRYEDRWITLLGNENESKDNLYKQVPEDLAERYFLQDYVVVDWNIEEIWHRKGNKY